MLTDSTAHFTNRLVKLGRGQVKQVIALITGHGHFRISESTFSFLESQATCRSADCNNFEETAKRIILDCKRLGLNRRDLFYFQQPWDESDASICKKHSWILLRAQALA